MSRLRQPPRLLRVKRSEKLDFGMQRITLSSDAVDTDSLAGFPENRNGSHIKLFFPRTGQVRPVMPVLGKNGPVFPPSDIRPVARTYSVRKYCPKKQELVIDFVIHGYRSPASSWAVNAKPGDYLGIAGPGGPDPLLPKGSWHIIAGDLSALPAISAIMEDGHSKMDGQVIIEANENLTADVFINNTSLQIKVVKANSSGKSQSLIDAVENVDFQGRNEDLAVFVAGESSMVVHLRRYFISRFGLDKTRMYAIPYWRSGKNEENYHQERHRIMDEMQ